MADTALILGLVGVTGAIVGTATGAIIAAHSTTAVEARREARVRREEFTEAHLALEVREDRLDHEPDACLGDLGWWPFAEPVFLRGDEVHIDEVEGAFELGAPEAFVSEQDRAGVRGGQLETRFVFAFVGGRDRVADRDPGSV